MKVLPSSFSSFIFSVLKQGQAMYLHADSSTWISFVSLISLALSLAFCASYNFILLKKVQTPSETSKFLPSLCIGLAAATGGFQIFACAWFLGLAFGFWLDQVVTAKRQKNKEELKARSLAQSNPSEISPERYWKLVDRLVELTKPDRRERLNFSDWTERLGEIAQRAKLSIKDISWSQKPASIVISMIDMAQMQKGKAGFEELESIVASEEEANVSSNARKEQEIRYRRSINEKICQLHERMLELTKPEAQTPFNVSGWADRLGEIVRLSNVTPREICWTQAPINIVIEFVEKMICANGAHKALETLDALLNELEKAKSNS